MSKAAALADLKKSGLTAADFKKLKIKVVTPAQNVKLTSKQHNVPGYVFPYFDLKGKPIKNAWRRRNLQIPLGPFGAVRSEPGKWRYTGPSGELPHLFFPRNFGNWSALAKDVTEPIFITEGEKKAACMCKNGFATIAVPGVWGWKSKERDIRIIKDFDWIDWGDAENPRPVYMCFDNDVIIKPQVLGALNALSRELLKKGAEVFIKYLPDGPLKGADDFIAAKGADAFDDLDSKPFSDSSEIWKFQETVAYIKANNFFIDVTDLRTFPDMAKLRQAFGNLSYEVLKADGDGYKTVYVVDEWLRFNHRREHSKLVFAPGQPVTIGKTLNTWRAWGCEPKKGGIKPFLDLVKYIFATEPGAIDWFMKWLAYPLQHPGTKLQSGVLIWSQNEGVGKTFIGEIMRGIYGDSFSRIEKEDIVGDWNDWLINKQFILGEEITGGDSRHVADKVKNMISRKTAISKIKYQATFEINDCANYFLTSNHEDSLHLSQQDRRWLVVNVATDKLSDDWYKKIDNWAKSGGDANLFHYLLTEIDVSDFNPMAAAPATSAKTEMADLSKSSMEMRVEALLNNPDEYLKLGGMAFERDVYTVSDILKVLDLPANNENPVSRILTKLQVPKKKTKSHRFAALRNQQRWRRASSIEWSENYEKDFKANKYTKEK